MTITRVVHVVRCGDTDSNFADVKVIDAIAFQGINGQEEVLFMPASKAIVLRTDNTGDGNGNLVDNITRVTHMERMSSGFDVEIFDAIAFVGINGKEELLFNPGTVAVEGKTREIISQNQTITDANNSDNTLDIHRVNGIAYEGINGQEMLLVMPLGGITENDITKYNNDGSPPANSDPHVYVFFPSSFDGQFNGDTIKQGFLWWITNIGGGGGVFVTISVGVSSSSGTSSISNEPSGSLLWSGSNTSTNTITVTDWYSYGVSAVQQFWVRDQIFTGYIIDGIGNHVPQYTPGPPYLINGIATQVYNAPPGNLTWTSTGPTSMVGYASFDDAMTHHDYNSYGEDLSPSHTAQDAANSDVATQNAATSAYNSTPPTSPPSIYNGTIGTGAMLTVASIDRAPITGGSYGAQYILKIKSIPSNESPEALPAFTITLSGADNYSINIAVYPIKDNVFHPSDFIFPIAFPISPVNPSPEHEYSNPIWEISMLVPSSGDVDFLLSRQNYMPSPEKPIVELWPKTGTYSVSIAIKNDAVDSPGSTISPLTAWQNISGPPPEL